MRVLLTVSFFGMATAHIVSLGLLRYFPVIGVMVLILVLGKNIYLPPDRWWYPIGCLLFLIPSGIVSFLYGNSLSYAYVAFGLLNFLLYPAFERVKLTNLHLALIFAGLSVTLIPLGVGRRVASIYDNPNNYSAVVFATMYFGMLLFRKRFLGQLAVMALFTFLIYLGASRSMLGAILLFGLMYFSQAWLLKRTIRYGLVIAFAASSFGYYSLITSDEFKIMEVIKANTPSDKKQRGLSHRDELFEQSLELVKRQPFGYGLGMSKDALKEYYGTSISPHNTYLKVAVEGGVIALGGFLILVCGFWLSSTSPLASSFIFALMVRGFFESSTPLSVSLISGMLIIPMFLNEQTVIKGYRLPLFPKLSKSPGMGAETEP